MSATADTAYIVFSAFFLVDIITVDRYNVIEVICMTVNELMHSKGMTKYRLSKNSGIPYATVNDIVNGKAQLEKCSVETVYKLAKELGVSMESLIAPRFDTRCSFELFKSNVCHKLKAQGDLAFIADTLERDEIRLYYTRKWYPESFYLLAMLDYISRINNIPLCNSYSDIRKQKLSTELYPAGIIALSAAAGNNEAKKQALKTAIPEFRRFNIIESEIRDVI